MGIIWKESGFVKGKPMSGKAQRADRYSTPCR
jgi:hypothetical protein